MAVVGDRRVGCDGCGRTVALEDLTTVTMPDGEQVACCPACEPHARAAARKGDSLNQRREACDGCTETYLAAELEDIVLEDGTVLTCCRSCVAEAPAGDGDDESNENGESDESGESNENGESDESGESDVDDAGTDGAGTAAVSDTADDESDGDRAICSQCQEWVTEERFRVTTIDERTERLCPDCKTETEAAGIIVDVAMRKTRAREVLDVDTDASDDAIREAFHRQVKRAHPDRQTGSRSAFNLVTEAYERLREED
ncbi:J domain-containing protein [Natrinema sp. SYSU A 869]|uniref:J domain-containing protein n=1 Tax=Natrinema sp. SYSU A 869 TaxID=2871694 RepID=UPI001CA434E8|nr:J domain-containing protein [Natrinema sp. SYSU A 869]